MCNSSNFHNDCVAGLHIKLMEYKTENRESGKKRNSVRIQHVDDILQLINSLYSLLIDTNHVFEAKIVMCSEGVKNIKTQVKNTVKKITMEYHFSPKILGFPRPENSRLFQILEDYTSSNEASIRNYNNQVLSRSQWLLVGY